MSRIDLSRSWGSAPGWVKVWFVLGAIALVGGISWDRVQMQNRADAFIDGFPERCATLALAEDEDGACGCLLAAIKAEYGTGRVLARQSAYWTDATLAEFATANGCAAP